MHKHIWLYLDETELTIEDRRHLLLACLGVLDPERLGTQLIDAKYEVGIEGNQEIKWNQKGLHPAVKTELKNKVLGFITGAEVGFIALSESRDKTKALNSLLSIIEPYLEEQVAAFSIVLDKDLCPNLEALYRRLSALQPKCLSLQESVSARDQVLQLVDIVAGFFSFAIQSALGYRSLTIQVEYVPGEEPIDFDLGGYACLQMRHLLPGDVEQVTELHDYSYPLKKTLGKGLIIDSTISVDAWKAIEEDVANFYLGCMH